MPKPPPLPQVITLVAVTTTAVAAVAAFIGVVILILIAKIARVNKQTSRRGRETYVDDGDKAPSEELETAETTEVRLMSRETFAHAALASPHLMPRGGGGGWATPADARARGHSTLKDARIAYADGAIDVHDIEEGGDNGDNDDIEHDTQLPSASRRAQRELRSDPPKALRPLFLCAREADRACRAAGYAVLADIPWKIAVLRDDIEAGLPHTVSDIVCLPRSLAMALYMHDIDERVKTGTGTGTRAKEEATKRRVMSTLVHEKVHVYQRLRPTDARRFIREELGCERFLDVSSSPYFSLNANSAGAPLSSLLERTRSNPDVDGWLYTCSSSRKTTTLTVYAHDPPASVLDTHRVVVHAYIHGGGLAVKYDDNVIVEMDDKPGPDREHPYETMAYVLQDRIAPFFA